MTLPYSTFELELRNNKISELEAEKEEMLQAFKRIVESEDAKDMYDIALDICEKYKIKVNTEL
jgi:hypothetical protein